MHTNLTKVGGKWAVEVIGGPDDETLVKTFGSREEAETWRRDMTRGDEKPPVLKPKRAQAKKPKKKAKAK